MNRKTLSARTEGQKNYIISIVSNRITLCTGPAGTGKTAVSIALACQMLYDDEQYPEIDQIVISRPCIDSGKSFGALPGELDDKIHPYLIPAKEELEKWMGPQRYFNSGSSANKKAKGPNNKSHILEPLELMRGRTFNNSIMILDEAQNATFAQIKMFITRMGEYSKVIVNGDIKQTDLKSRESGGLEQCIERLDHLNGIETIRLTTDDVVRDTFLRSVIIALED